MSAVRFESVSKNYPVYDSPGDRLKELLTFNRIRRHRDFRALEDITFEVRKGETFCIVGENGSGKSTLLQIVAGILQPSSGSVEVAGRVAALLELGAGFNPEFSGRDNVHLNGSILGLSRKQIDSRFASIEEFAEIGAFIDQPVKTYSSGMLVRLAFAVAIHVDPEILLVDEALAVGDIYFRHRCMRKVHELRSRGVTILFVSHATADVKAVGDRAMWLEHGRMVDIGAADRVVSRYLAAMSEKDSRYLTQKHAMPVEERSSIQAREIVDRIPNIDARHGDRRAEILGIAVLDEEGHPLHLVEPSTRLILRISVRANRDLALPIVGFLMRNHQGIDLAGTNTAREDTELPSMQAGDIFTVDFHIDLPELYPASFSFSPAISYGSLEAYRVADWIENAITFQMGRGDREVYGYFHMPCRVEVNAQLWDRRESIAVAEKAVV